MNSSVAILQDIEKHLQKHLNRAKVQIYPQNPKNWRYQNAGNAVLIGFNSSVFSDDIASDLIVQERALNIELVVIARSMHNELGALEFLDEVRQKITGFRPLNAKPILLTSEEFLMEEAGAWFYKLNIKTTTEQIQTIDRMEI